MYEAIASDEVTYDEFFEVYEMIVTESPLAMFIGMKTSADKAKALLQEKIKFNKQAEVGYLNIHGIGKTNIKLIKKLLEDNEVAGVFVEEPRIELIGNSIKATIYF